jgi:CHAT domain-containing protein
VAGPRLHHAAEEVRRVAACHPRSSVLSGEDASVRAVVSAFGSARLVHVAAHGRIRHDNAFHSTLELADGAVSVLDLVRLEHVPRTVVLASCGSGHVAQRAGDQLVGLTTALLVAGAREVVVASGDLPDAAATVEVMETLHRRLARGTPASVALAESVALSGDPLGEPVRASLIAVGAG